MNAEGDRKVSEKCHVSGGHQCSVDRRKGTAAHVEIVPMRAKAWHVRDGGSRARSAKPGQERAKKHSTTNGARDPVV